MMPQPMFLCFSRPKLFTGSENPVVDDIYILSESQPHCPPLPRPQCDLNILDNLDKTGSHLKKGIIMERITSNLAILSILICFHSLYVNAFMYDGLTQVLCWYL